MDHDRAVQFVIGTLVGQVETFGQVVVHLNRSQLPLATDGIFHHEVQLRAIERRFSKLHDSVESFLLCGLHDSRFGFLPVLVRTDILLAVVGITQRNLCRIAVELQRPENIEHDVDNAFELFEQLVGTHEQVGVVLRETTHTSQAVQLARLLVTVDRTELGQPHRQLLV